MSGVIHLEDVEGTIAFQKTVNAKGKTKSQFIEHLGKNDFV